MNITSYTEDHAEEWDKFVENSFNGTFLHSRRYLSYHGSRFKDVSLLIYDAKNHLVGILPAAVSPLDSAEVVSHPGITYGGLLHNHHLQGAGILSSFEKILDQYRALGFKGFLYKAIPRVYHLIPSEDDLYALFRLGAERVRCDLSSAVDLKQRHAKISRSLRNSLKNARRNDIRVEYGMANLEGFWEVLSGKLSRRHGVSPVHTVEEMLELASKFPNKIELAVGFYNSKVVAGTVLFKTRLSTHAQYGACNEEGSETGALDYVIENCITNALNENKRYFNFGISNEQEGTILNEGLHQFKMKFGGGGIVHEFYRIKL